MRFITAISAIALGACAHAGLTSSLSPGSAFIPGVIQHGGSPNQWEMYGVGAQDPVALTGGIPGQIWVSESQGNALDKFVIATGVMTHFPMPKQDSYPYGITTGPDGNVWFAELAARIGRMTPSGSLTEFPLPSNSAPFGIAFGPDGNVWFTDIATRAIGRMTLKGAVTEFSIPSRTFPVFITAGADGNLWFTESAAKIGKITPDGVITEYATPTQALETIGITLAQDGNIWFTESTQHRLGRVTPSGQVTDYFVKGLDPSRVVPGGDGDELYVMLATPGLAQYNIRTHHFVKLGYPPGGHGAGDLARGSDGNIWFTEEVYSKLDVYIRQVLTVTPASLTLQSRASATLAASEERASAPLQATTSDPGVALVAPAGDDTFTVTAVAKGSCTITIRDHKDNTFPVPVTVD